MFHRSTGSTHRQRVSVVVLALTLILTMAFPAAAAPSRPDPFYSDFGDLPATYPTSTADAPVHQLQLVPGGLMLGQCVDGEPNGQPTATAKGDDDAIGHPAYGVPSCASDDEDGVTRVAGKGGASNGGGWTNGTVLSGNGGAVQVTITGGSACLGAYFDLLRNGTLPLATLRNADNSPVTQPIAAGTYTFYFDIPDGTFNGTPPGQPIYARFRVTSPVGTESNLRRLAGLPPHRPGAGRRGRGLPVELRPQRRDPIGHDGIVRGNAAGAAPGACDLPGCPGRRHRACTTPRLAPSGLTGQPDYRLMPAPPSKCWHQSHRFRHQGKVCAAAFCDRSMPILAPPARHPTHESRKP